MIFILTLLFVFNVAQSYVLLLAIQKNCNRLILGVVPSIYQNTDWKAHCAQYGFDINHHIGFSRVLRGQLLKLQFILPLIMATVVPSLVLVA